MDTKALRQKILDLAIRGKLVPQDPNDEPASVLLERIRAEKQQMVKDGKLKAKDIKNDTVIFKGDDNLHYEQFADGTVKCIEDEIPFELPDSWAWARLGNIGEIITGGTPSKSHHEYYGNAFPFFKPADLDQGRKTIISSEYLSEKGKAYCRIIPKFSTAVCCIGSIGKCGYLNVEGTTNQQINSIIPNIDSLYVYYYCSSDCFSEQLLSLASATTIAIVNKSKLESVFIPVPPMVEQKRIANTLDTALELIETLEVEKSDILVAINNVKFKILDLAIRGKLVPQDPNDEPASVLLERIRAEKEELIKQGKIKRDKKESIIFKGDDNSYYEKIGNKLENIDNIIPFEIPDTWQWCRGYSCFTGMESEKPSGEFFDYIDIDAIDNHLHRIKKTKRMLVSNAPSRASRAVKTGSVLFSLVRPYLENIALVDEKYANSIVSTGFYVCNSSGALYPEYMFCLMISGYVVNGLNQFMKGDNSPSISKDNIENWLYPIPPLNEQKMICHKMKRLFSEIEATEKSLS